MGKQAGGHSRTNPAETLHQRVAAGLQPVGEPGYSLLFAGILLIITASAATAADAYLPADDNEVLETLPRSLLAGQDELATLRRQLSDKPDDSTLACQVAQQYIQVGNLEGDPRFYGYARAALRPWWDAERPPPSVLKLRAKLRDKDHEYEAALADLRQLLQQEPRDAQAWIELANIYRVQGRYAEAQAACDTLEQFAGRVPTTLCRAPLQAATGSADQAYASLATILPESKARWPTTVQWILTMQAQIAQALGHTQQAEKHYIEGLANTPGDRYLLRAYGDLLLDTGREAEALSLLRDFVSDNGIMLCAAIAARRTGQNTLAAEWQTQLESRFDETRLRGDQPHGRFEARCALELDDDPQRALTIALANWQQQKESRDTRNVLESAIAAGDPDAAQPAVMFLKEAGTEDVMLRRLVEQLGSN